MIASEHVIVTLVTINGAAKMIQANVWSRRAYYPMAQEFQPLSSGSSETGLTLIVAVARSWSPRYFFSFFQQAQPHGVEDRQAVAGGHRDFAAH